MDNKFVSNLTIIIATILLGVGGPLALIYIKDDPAPTKMSGAILLIMFAGFLLFISFLKRLLKALTPPEWKEYLAPEPKEKTSLLFWLIIILWALLILATPIRA
jgi:hypothetical protein